MKVLFITPSYPLPANSGAAVAALETLRSIHSQCDLHLLTPPPAVDSQYHHAVADGSPLVIGRLKRSEETHPLPRDGTDCRPSEVNGFEQLLQETLPGIVTHYYPAVAAQTPRFEMYKTAAKACFTGSAYWAMIWFNPDLRDAVKRLHSQEHFNAIHCEWLVTAL